MCSLVRISVQTFAGPARSRTCFGELFQAWFLACSSSSDPGDLREIFAEEVVTIGAGTITWARKPSGGTRKRRLEMSKVADIFETPVGQDSVK